MVDFDHVNLMSLNCHTMVTLKDMGIPKATVLLQYLRETFLDNQKSILDPVVKMMLKGNKETDGSMMDPQFGVVTAWGLND